MISSLNFISLNVGMSASLAGLETLIEAEKLDIIFLQEVRLTSEQIENKLREFNASANIDSDNPTRPGTAIVWKVGIPVEQTVSLAICRLQVATLGNYKLFNVYAPSGSCNKQARINFFGQDLFNVLNLSQGFKVVAGDFNSVMDKMDVENGKGFDQKKCVILKDIMRSMSLSDVFRSKYPFSSEFTFFRPGCTSSRLDRVYLSNSLLSKVTDKPSCFFV